MRSVVGREFSRRTSFPIAASDIRRWATAVYWPEPPPAEFWRDGDGMGADGSLLAPQEFNPFAWMTDEGPSTTNGHRGHDPDRNFTMLGVEGPHLQHQVNGGVEVTYTSPMRVGDVITASTCIAELTEREGRLGLMLFTTTETVLENQHGETVRRERMTVISY